MSAGVVVTLGIDLAKRVFSLHGVDKDGHVVLRRVVRREQLTATIARLPPCLIGLEACSGAHAWARQFIALGHAVRIMAAGFVQPYRKSAKNDNNDAQAICEAVSRPSMRFVPVKTEDQQALLSLHRVRQGFVSERTAMINRVRGLLAEFGVVVPCGAQNVTRQAAVAAEGLPVPLQRTVLDLLSHIRLLQERICEYEHRLQELAKGNKLIQHLQSIPGVGALTASAVVGSIGDPRLFRNGRQFAAWLGLVPRQASTGGKTRLGSITKKGDAYLRTLLILGARTVIVRAARKTDRLSRWLCSLEQRRGWRKAVVALAAKNARIIWALMTSGRRFERAV